MNTETDILEAEERPEDRSAFSQCSDMEDSLAQIKNLIAALCLIAEGEHATGHKRNSEALYGIANALEAAHEDLDERWDQLSETLVAERK